MTRPLSRWIEHAPGYPGTDDDRVGRSRGRAVRWAVAAAAVLIVLLVVAQLVLPGIAERRVRDELARIGTPSDVEVSSFPAVKLLLGQVDSLSARLESSEASADEVADLIASTEEIDRLRVSTDRIELSGLELRDAMLAKDDERLRAEASLTRQDLLALLPAGSELRSIGSEGGELLLDGSFSALGFQFSGVARASPSDGAIVLAPEGVAGLARLTVFSDDRLRIEALDAQETGESVRLGIEGRVVAG